MSKILVPVQNVATGNLDFPAAALVLPLNSENAKPCLVIDQAGAANIAASYYDDLENGSIMFDLTASTCRIYVKTGTIGLRDGTWKYQAIAT